MDFRRGFLRKVCLIMVMVLLQAGSVSAAEVTETAENPETLQAEESAQLAEGAEASDSAEISAEEEAACDWQNHWAQTQIDTVIEKGYMYCPEEGRFLPDQGMTRAMFVEALASMAGVVFAEDDAFSGDMEAENQDPADQEEPSDAPENADGESSENASLTDITADTADAGGSGSEETAVPGEAAEAVDSDEAADPEDEENEDSEEAVQWGIDASLLQEAEEPYIPDLQALAEKFADIDGTESYAPALAWGVEKGVVNGMGECFCPDLTIDRQTLAVMMYRAVDILDINLEEDWSIMLDFNDLSEVDDWAVEGISYCCMTGLMKGTTGGFFAPKKILTRAEAAVVICRLAARTEKNA